MVAGVSPGMAVSSLLKKKSNPKLVTPNPKGTLISLEGIPCTLDAEPFRVCLVVRKHPHVTCASTVIASI